MKNYVINRNQFNDLLFIMTGWNGFNNNFKIVKKVNLTYNNYPNHQDVFDGDWLEKKRNEIAKNCKDDESVAFSYKQATSKQMLSFIRKLEKRYEEEHKNDFDGLFEGTIGDWINDWDYQKLKLLEEILTKNIKK